jgi:hypothetical protein
MKAIGRHKLTRKVLLLFVLSGTLVYLRHPDKAQALFCNGCDQGCLNQYAICYKNCNGVQSCISGCEAVFKACTKACPPCNPEPADRRP